MRGFEVSQATVLDVGNAPARELELEQVGVVRGPRQDRLIAQLHALLPRLQHALADLGRLSGFVPAEDQLGPRAGLELRPQLLGERAAGLSGERVRGGEDRLRGAVVPLQRDHGRVGKVRGELKDVLG